MPNADVSNPRPVDGLGRQVVSIWAAWHPGGRSVQPWPDQQRVREVHWIERGSSGGAAAAIVDVRRVAKFINRIAQV